MRINEVLEQKEWLLLENKKFDSRKGKMTYKVRNQASDIVESINYAKKLSESRVFRKEMSESYIEQIKIAEEEILPLAERLTSFRSFQESTLHDYMRLVGDKYSKRDNWYFICLDLVNMVNAWWDITDEKPANRIAWGWEKCREKDNPQAYLYGCIRNYLKRNGKFDKEEFNGIWTGRSL